MCVCLHVSHGETATNIAGDSAQWVRNDLISKKYSTHNSCGVSIMRTRTVLMLKNVQ